MTKKIIKILNQKKWLKANDYFVLLLVLGILVLLNYLFTLLPIRLDLTANRSHSLSKQSKNILKELDDIVTIKVFVSKNLPLRLSSSADELRDTLKEYQNLSGGKLKVKYLDPGDDPKLLQEAQGLGIPKLQFSDIADEKFQLSQGFFGLAMTYADKSESIPLLDSTANLEYELTSRLAKLTRKEDIKIAFSAGHDEDSAYNGLQFANQILSQEFEVGNQKISTESGQLLDTANNLLIIAGPKIPFTPDETYLLDQYLMKGKSILILGGSTQVDEQMQTSSFDSGLNPWLSNFQLKLQDNLILDSSNEVVNFNTGVTSFFVPYPFWLKLQKDYISDHSVVNTLETATIPWTSSLEIKEGDKNKPQVLFNSSNQALEQTGLFNIDPTQEYDVKESDLKSFPLAAIVEGELTSAFTKDSRPELYQDSELVQSNSQGKLAVIPSSYLIKDDFIDRFGGNAILLMNLAEYLASDVDLSDIRSKGETIRPLRQIPDSQKGLLKYANIFGVSLAVIVLAFVYLGKRNLKNNQKE